MVESLKEICLNYIKKSCSKEEISFWKECSLYCLPFKIFGQIQTRANFFCSCEPFVCKKSVSTPNIKEYLIVLTVALMETVLT